jgi:propionyl-CoA carboxylase alpha chain
MLRAIEDYQIAGVNTTLPFCAFALSHEAFVSGKFDTHFVSEYFTPEVLEEWDEKEEKVAAMLVGKLFDNSTGDHSVSSTTEHNEISNWKKNRSNNL